MEFEKITYELNGGIILDLNLRYTNYLGFCVLRMTVGVGDREVIPLYHKMKMMMTIRNF